MSPHASISVILLLAVCGCDRNSSISLTSSSPDGAYRVEMVEYPSRLDLNFYLRLHDLTWKTNATIFDSPDEGRAVGTDRIVWSRDNSRMVLIGRHFFVGDAARLTNGEAIYLLYDIKSGNIRCNATQQSKYPSFTRDDLKNTDWNGDI